MGVSILFHGGTPMDGATGEVGSQLYDLMPEHLPALWAMGLVVMVGMWLVRWGRGTRIEAFRRLPLRVRAIAALLLISGAAHAGLAGVSTGGWRVLFAASAAMAAIVALRIVDGKTWRRWTGLLLAGSLIGYWIELIGGHPADQIGITVKAIEVFALYLVLSPSPAKAGRRRFRQAAATAGLVLISVLNATAVWAGAFGSASGDTNLLDHHSNGSISPGMVMNAGGATEISVADQAEADQLWAATTAFTARYQRPIGCGRRRIPRRRHGGQRLPRWQPGISERRADARSNEARESDLWDGTRWTCIARRYVRNRGAQKRSSADRRCRP